MAHDPLKSGSLEVIDEVCDDFERRYRDGESPRIEAFLETVPDTDRGSLLVELIAVDVCFRRSAQQTPEPVEYIARFPQYEPQILELFASESSQSISRGVTQRSFGGSCVRSTPAVTGQPLMMVGRYQLISLLGHGGFGEVWKGVDTELQRAVAVKLMRSDLGHTSELAALFVSEGRKLARLTHPGVVTVFDVGQSEGRCYIVSELIEGGTLADRLKTRPFTPTESAVLVANIGDALHHAHLQDLIHRDIKPKNILLSATGEPKLADFGLAANEEDQLVETPATMGTVAYMSPELIRGESHHTDARTDIYSLGVVLYQALTGRLPFVAHSTEQFREQILEREPRPPRTIDDRIPPELERICLKCLKKNLDDRYTTAADLARELRAAVTAPPPALPAVATGKQQRRSLGAAGLLLAAIGMAAIGGAAVIAWRPPQAVEPVSKGLAYDETLPQFHRPVSRWNRLLNGPPPQKLVWSGDDPDGLFLHHPEQSEVVVSRSSLGLLALGRVTEPAYRLELDLHQPQWAGRIGVFFGYHADGHPNAPDYDPSQIRYQTITVENFSGGLFLCRSLYSEQIEGPEEAGLPSAKQLALASVPMPQSDSQSLELEVFRNRIKVWWAGEEIKALSDDAFQTIEEADQVGYFGIFVHKSNGIVRDARVMPKRTR
ncbi:MAG TPA: serine/threonine-protein kinase [Planctomycetaceae bacterium]|nr:serine/threonine-protein kinase [Planctomycetaceae bacterium]